MFRLSHLKQTSSAQLVASCKPQSASKIDFDSLTVSRCWQVGNAALGAFIGAAVGNAAGTMLDLYCRIPEDQVEDALRWRSSNGSRRAHGQVFSMTLSQLSGLGFRVQLQDWPHMFTVNCNF